MVSSLLHLVSLSLPELVKSSSVISQARLAGLADKTAYWTAPSPIFTAAHHQAAGEGMEEWQ